MCYIALCSLFIVYRLIILTFLYLSSSFCFLNLFIKPSFRVVSWSVHTCIIYNKYTVMYMININICILYNYIRIIYSLSSKYAAYTHYRTCTYNTHYPIQDILYYIYIPITGFLLLLSETSLSLENMSLLLSFCVTGCKVNWSSSSCIFAIAFIRRSRSAALACARDCSSGVSVVVVEVGSEEEEEA